MYSPNGMYGECKNVSARKQDICNKAFATRHRAVVAQRVQTGSIGCSDVC